MKALTESYADYCALFGYDSYPNRNIEKCALVLDQRDHKIYGKFRVRLRYLKSNETCEYDYYSSSYMTVRELFNWMSSQISLREYFNKGFFSLDLSFDSDFKR